MLLYFAITSYISEGQQRSKQIHSTGTINLIPLLQLQPVMTVATLMPHQGEPKSH